MPQVPFEGITWVMHGGAYDFNRRYLAIGVLISRLLESTLNPKS